MAKQIYVLQIFVQDGERQRYERCLFVSDSENVLETDATNVMLNYFGQCYYSKEDDMFWVDDTLVTVDKAEKVSKEEADTFEKFGLFYVETELSEYIEIEG